MSYEAPVKRYNIVIRVEDCDTHDYVETSVWECDPASNGFSKNPIINSLLEQLQSSVYEAHR